jgi:hypothetical protein
LFPRVSMCWSCGDDQTNASMLGFVLPEHLGVPYAMADAILWSQKLRKIIMKMPNWTWVSIERNK